MHSQVVKTLRWPHNLSCLVYTYLVCLPGLVTTVGLYSWEQVKLWCSSVKSEDYPGWTWCGQDVLYKGLGSSWWRVPQIREALWETLHCWLWSGWVRSWLGTVMTFGAKLILWSQPGETVFSVIASRNRIFQPPECLLVDFALEPLGSPQLSQPVVPAWCSPEQWLPALWPSSHYLWN